MSWLILTSAPLAMRQAGPSSWLARSLCSAIQNREENLGRCRAYEAVTGRYCSDRDVRVYRNRVKLLFSINNLGPWNAQIKWVFLIKLLEHLQSIWNNYHIFAYIHRYFIFIKVK